MRIGIDIDDTVSKTNEKLIEAAIEYDKKRVKGKGFRNPDAYSFMEMFYWNVMDVDTFMKTFRSGNYFLELEEVKKNSDKDCVIYFKTFPSINFLFSFNTSTTTFSPTKALSTNITFPSILPMPLPK